MDHNWVVGRPGLQSARHVQEILDADIERRTPSKAQVTGASRDCCGRAVRRLTKAMTRKLLDHIMERSNEPFQHERDRRRSRLQRCACPMSGGSGKMIYELSKDRRALPAGGKRRALKVLNSKWMADRGAQG